jgi:AAA ATPase domain
MRLESFRIYNCFGFVDSGEIDLSAPGNLIYFLGRNSSGKTSVLRAIASFVQGRVPAQQVNFENYEPPEGPVLLRARFSVHASDEQRLSAGDVADAVRKRINTTALRIGRSSDGFSIQDRSYVASSRAAIELLEQTLETYQELAEQILESGQVWVEKYPDGSYRFFTELDDYENVQQRQSSIDPRINQLTNVTRRENTRYPTGLDFASIESMFFAHFPTIYIFTDRFKLDENLPRSIAEGQLSGDENAITEAFISLLGPETLRDLLRTHKRARINDLTRELQGKVDALCARINEDSAKDAADDHFLQMYVERTAAVRIIIEVDGRESYYEHLSDNTKFLVAYHIFQSDRERRNYQGAILLFDEPNKGFHPSAEGKVLRFLELLGERGNQVLLTTHSQHMIDLDRLTAVRIMRRNRDNDTLRVDNRLYGNASSASTDTLALQPITDALGLHYADQLVTRDKVIVTEGYTDMLYLRLFARLLGRDEPNIAPVTGEGKVLTLISFLISQGLSFKVEIDSPRSKSEIQQAVPIPDASLFVVSEHLGVRINRPSGIEDLFSRDDFESLLQRCGHVVNDQHLSNVVNSEYARATGIKTIIAHEAYESTDLDRSSFSRETLQNFTVLLDFCENECWFRA